MMSTIRARFEEIWPVPDYAFWSQEDDMYIAYHHDYDLEAWARNLRLDTFTRCQETMAPAMSLVDELVASIERAEILICNIDAPTTGSGYSELMDWAEFETAPILDRAKQIIGREK